MKVSADPRFADRLKQLRESANLSQYALAKKSGLSAQAISMIEKGEREPGWETVRKLAKALGVSVAAFDVIGESEPESGDSESGNPSEPTVNDTPKQKRKPK